MQDFTNNQELMMAAGPGDVVRIDGRHLPPILVEAGEQTWQHFAAIRMLFDWLVVRQVLPMNPAAAVRGPRHVVKKGKTPVLTLNETRRILDGIDTTKIIGLRDRALIGVLVFTFARISAAVAMKVADVFVQNDRFWVRLHEKGGKLHTMPCQHNLEDYLKAYPKASGRAGRPKRPLFPTLGRSSN